MPEFPHLPLPTKLGGTYLNPKRKFEKKISDTTRNNLLNRVPHGRTLRQTVAQVSRDWNNEQENRAELNFPKLPSDSTPIFLQLDRLEFDAESLHSFGIEIISEEEDGFIIGASADNFRSLNDKINDFITN